MKHGSRVTYGDPAVADFILFHRVGSSCHAWTLLGMFSEANLTSEGGRGIFNSNFVPFLSFLKES